MIAHVGGYTLTSPPHPMECDKMGKERWTKTWDGKRLKIKEMWVFQKDERWESLEMDKILKLMRKKNQDDRVREKQFRVMLEKENYDKKTKIRI